MRPPRPDYCCGRCPEVVSGGVDCTCKDNPRCRGVICECGHGALDHHGTDGRMRRDAGCQTNTRRDDWCRCPYTAPEVTERSML